jgi:hypothetical protein
MSRPRRFQRPEKSPEGRAAATSGFHCILTFAASGILALPASSSPLSPFCLCFVAPLHVGDIEPHYLYVAQGIDNEHSTSAHHHHRRLGECAVAAAASMPQRRGSPRPYPLLGEDDMAKIFGPLCENHQQTNVVPFLMLDAASYVKLDRLPRSNVPAVWASTRLIDSSCGRQRPAR